MMEENSSNVNNLDAEQARKLELLNEMNKLKFNNVNSEQITNDMFNSISSEPQIEVKPVEQEIQIESIKVNNEIQNNISDIKLELKEEVKVEQFEEPLEKEEINPNEPQKNLNKNISVSYFDGSLLDLMGWNFLRNILKAFTFGLGGAWGDCLYLKYKLSHTVLNGKRLKFEGQGSEYFVEQFKWTFLTIITLGIYALWIPINKTKWLVSNIHFEDSEFDKTKTFFCGSMLRLLGINILCILITVISFGILAPLAECIKLRWIVKNTVINDTGIIFKGKTLSLYGKYIKWIFLTIITLGIYSLWVPIRKIDWEVENTELMN